MGRFHPHVPYKHRLAIYVAWHPKFAAGAALAGFLYARLSRDTASPLARGMGIPVLFRSAPGPACSGTPGPIPLDEAHHTAVILLVDDEMVADDVWSEFVLRTWEAAERSGGSHRVYPVKLSPNAFNIQPLIAGSNFMRPLDNTGLSVVTDPPAQSARISLSIAVVHELCRLITGQPRLDHDAPGSGRVPRRVTIFISHTKADGEPIANGIKEYIRRDTQLGTFFDANDIPYGENFERVLKSEIPHAALLVVQTDTYAASPWCLMELLEAKKHMRPVLVVNALKAGEERGPVYGGNVPSHRLEAAPAPDPPYTEIVERLLIEILRREHFVQHFRDLAALFGIPDDVKPIPYPPEPLTIADLRMAGETSTTFVYPDPPINRLELERLRVLDERITVTTPLLLLATGGLSAAELAEHAVGTRTAPRPTASPGPTPRLAGLTVGLSIGNCPDLPSQGMGNDHLNDALVAFALYLLASGARLAYGGIPQLAGSGSNSLVPNYLDILLDFVAAYSRLTGEVSGSARRERAEPRLVGYIAAPYRAMVETAEFKAKWRWAFAIKKPDPDVPPPASDASERERACFVARSLTAMRTALAKDVSAQVLMGGKVFGASGAYPGIVEECYRMLQENKPVYVIGGFGGAARLVSKALGGRQPAALTRAAHERDPRYAQLAADYDMAVADSQCGPIDFEQIVSVLNGIGVAGLSSRNQLTEEENRRLFESPHVPEIVYLVLKGLSRVASRS